ncbi:translation initiation factor eIF-2B subunit alpha [Podospora australis]|uniref:Translation initiation factor eIF2B subunit alpha n=1 Tax=Podospora australis TaxID=1536484 RepID=A0AAN7AMA6_9PEZI|nr:translation initiation factor eIF-2B subunit alpha [Podospora australis]
MATDDIAPPAQDLPVRPKENTSSSTTQNEPSKPFDIVATYRSLLQSDPEITMSIAAIEALIELMGATPSSTAMELVEKVRTEKAKLLASAPNPLPILAGADAFEQYLLRSLRGQSTAFGSGSASQQPVLSFDDTRQHLLQNRELFAHRAKEAREKIAIWGTRYVSDNKIVLTAGGSRTVTKILLRAAQDESKHFKVIYVQDGNPRSDNAIRELREAGLEVETIVPNKVAFVLGNQKYINLVLVGAEAIVQNGGIVSGMGTAQLAFLTRHVDGSMKRFYVAAETHKIARKTPVADPILRQLGIRQKEISRFEQVAVDPENISELLPEKDEVEYTEPSLIDGFITEQGIMMTSQIWEFTDGYL